MEVCLHHQEEKRKEKKSNCDFIACNSGHFSSNFDLKSHNSDFISHNVDIQLTFSELQRRPASQD